VSSACPVEPVRESIADQFLLGVNFLDTDDTTLY